jgi:hypothetical protein
MGKKIMQYILLCFALTQMNCARHQCQTNATGLKILIHAPYKIVASESAAIQKVIGDTLLVIPVEVYNPKSKEVFFWGPTYEILENRIISVLLPDFTFAKKIKEGKDLQPYSGYTLNQAVNDSTVIQSKSKYHFEIYLPLKMIIDNKCTKWQLIYLATKYPNNWRFRPLCDKKDVDLYPDFPYISSNIIHLKQ